MKRGFSLVELSITLVIIGLLAGGVVVGRSLVQTAQLRDILADVDTYNTSITNFQNKYKSLPGDMSNATNFWGKSAAVCNGHTGTAALPGTCNGDGNGQITLSGTGIPEFLRAWQQLQLAGFIDCDYSGVGGANNWHHVISPTPTILRNAPSSKYEGGGYSLYYQPLVSAADATLYQGTNLGNYGHVIVFGGQTTGAAANANPTVATTSAPILTTEDASFLDTKIDDGVPNTGKVLATKSGGTSAIPNCTTAGGAYASTGSARNCIAIFLLGL